MLAAPMKRSLVLLALLLAGCPRPTRGLLDAEVGDWVDYRWTSTEEVPVNPRCSEQACAADGFERRELGAAVRLQVVARGETTATLLATITPDEQGLFHRALTRGVVLTLELRGLDPPADSAYGKPHGGAPVTLGGERVACTYSSAETFAPCLAPGWLRAGGGVARVELQSVHGAFTATGEGHGPPAPIPAEALPAFTEGAWVEWRLPDPPGRVQRSQWRSQRGLVVRESSRGGGPPFSTARQPAALLAELMTDSRQVLRRAPATVTTWEGLAARAQVAARSPAVHFEETWLAADVTPPADLPLFNAVNVVSAVRQEPRADGALVGNEGRLSGWSR